MEIIETPHLLFLRFLGSETKLPTINREERYKFRLIKIFVLLRIYFSNKNMPHHQDANLFLVKK